MEIGGYAWEKAGKIWYIALTERLRERSDFQKAAIFTVDVAASLYGKGALKIKAVKRAWELVGITIK